MKFRINSIAIEGFKGFTDQQAIQISGKHLFIFGSNGYGKSSIMEAIRWCLFGLTGRPEEIVRNQFYRTGDCFVELELIDQNGDPWKIQRRFSPGGARSRMTILDPQGGERAQSEVFPFLTSLGPREGTYIVFGGPSQLPSRSRPLESIEISDFGKIIYAYLRLENVPDLIEKLNKLIEDQKEEERQLAQEIEEEEENITDELKEVEKQLASFLQEPPWGDAEPPTSTQTKRKTKKLIKQLSQQKGQESPEDLNGENLLNLAQRWIQDLAAPEQEELNKKISEIKEQQSKVKELHRKLQEENQVIKNIERQNGEIERKRRNLLDDNDPDGFRKELENFNRKIEQTSLLIEIIKKSQLYLENHGTKECFICLTKIDKKKLRGNIEQRLKQVEPHKLQNIQRRDELKTSLEELTRLDEGLERAKQILKQHQDEYGEKETLLYKILNLEKEKPTPENINSFLKNLEEQVAELEQSLESKQEYRRNWERKIIRLREEIRFHRYRDKKQRFETLLEIGLKPVEERFDELVEFRESLEEIRQVLSFELKEKLRDALPLISKIMTKVYKHLTNQVSFDRVQIELGEQSGGFSPKLLVRVVSSDGLNLPPLDPEQVLNGQALSALRLVPYFVFSRFQREAWELDLLLLDDPTQSFDVQRIDLLLEELGTAANHAQLIIATHEEEHFTLSKFFKKEEISIIHTTGFDIRGGPHIEMG